MNPAQYDGGLEHAELEGEMFGGGWRGQVRGLEHKFLPRLISN